MGMNVGTLVRLRPEYDMPGHGLGRIRCLYDGSNLCSVMWKDPVGSACSVWYVSELEALCENCRRPYAQHTSVGRCLFGATLWK